MHVHSRLVQLRDWTGGCQGTCCVLASPCTLSLSAEAFLPQLHQLVRTHAAWFAPWAGSVASQPMEQTKPCACTQPAAAAEGQGAGCCQL